MLTIDQIEDSFESHFREQMEDLPDHQLRAMLDDPRALLRHAPPYVGQAMGRTIIADVLDRRRR